MVGVTLSADDIRAAPPGVRRWLEQQAVRISEPASSCGKIMGYHTGLT